MWKYFVVSAVDISRVSCNLCSASVSRGGSGGPKKNFCTTNLRKHLDRKHNGEFRQLLADEEKLKLKLKQASNAAVDDHAVQTLDAVRPASVSRLQ